MPLAISVGLSRKASRNYQSAGISINVTAELDQALLAKPQELQHQIADLYHQAAQALDRQALLPPQERRRIEPANGNGRYPGSNGNGRPVAPAGRISESQRRAIIAIARRLGVDPEQEAQQLVGAGIEGLSLRQASRLIDHLKAMQAEGSAG